MAIFSSCTTPEKSMMEMMKLQVENPEAAKILVENGQLMVQLAQQGKVGTLRRVFTDDGTRNQEILLYYTVKMFQTAAIARHIDVLRFMVENGFDVTSHVVLRSLLHEIIDSCTEEDGLQPLLRFLLQQGLDVNFQRPKDHCTALHIACSRKFCDTASFLIIFGADVNAVGHKNLLPLNCAENAEATTMEEQIVKQKLVDVLLENHARRSWRRTPPKSNFASFSGSSSMFVHFSSQSITQDDDQDSSRGKLFDTGSAMQTSITSIID